MHLLFFVFAMLAVFALLTYGRLETFVQRSVLRKEYGNSYQKREREFFNKKQADIYINTHGAGVNQTDEESTPLAASEKDEEDAFPMPQQRLNTLLNLQPLLAETRNEQKFLSTYTITAKLMRVLYKDHPAFAHLYEQIPNLEHQILNRLIERVPTDKNKVKTAKNLANIDLEDPELQEAFYKMLKGTQKGDAFGYPSLLDFVTLKSKSTPISIYLAPPELLLALYDHFSIVEDILRPAKKFFTECRERKCQKKKEKKKWKSAFPGEPPQISTKLC